MKKVGKAPLNKDEKLELSNLREEYKKLKAKKQAQEKGNRQNDAQSSDSDDNKQIHQESKKADASSSDSEGEDLDTVHDDLSPTKNQEMIRMAQRARTSVSAEVFGKYHQKEAFVAKVVPKSDEQKQKIAKILGGAFMFMNLDQKDLNVVIDAISEKKVAPGEMVIKEGDPGDQLYIVESGKLTVTKLIDGQEKKVFEYDTSADPNATHVFGELALLYNAPRAATIIADTESFLWALDRQTFNHIVKDASQRKR